MLAWATFRKMVMLEQTLFGLPWAVASLLLAKQVVPEAELSWFLFFWVALAFVAARVAGMGFNRFIDRAIDAKNPRTAQRVLPSGEAQPVHVLAVIAVGVALLLFSCYQINMACFALSFVVAAALWLYSYLKRWTSFCHFGIGLILALVPVMAWIAVTGALQVEVLLLALSLGASITAVDMVYALGDVAFDRMARLYSFPAYWGEGAAIKMAQVLHVVSLSALVLFAWLTRMEALIWAAALPMACYWFWAYYRLPRHASANNSRIFFLGNTFFALGYLLAVAIEEARTLL